MMGRSCIFVNIGMWFERFVIIVTSLAATSCRRAGTYFKPTLVDILTFVGSSGLFLTLFLLFLRFLPMIAMAEVKTVMPIADAHSGARRSVGDYHGDIPAHVREKGHK